MTQSPMDREEAAVLWSRRFRHLRVPPKVKLVGFVVGFRSSDEGTTVEDLGTVADQCGLPIGTVRAAVELLMAQGWLELDPLTTLLRPCTPVGTRAGARTSG